MKTTTTLALHLLLCLSFTHVNTQEAVQLVPALYVFGDSTVAGGNSDGPQLPYGMDLNSSTIHVRWTNGITIADFIAVFLGLPLVPPYNKTSTAEQSKTGVNYGYPGCGFLQETCQDQWSFNEQISRFNLTMTNLTKIFNQDELLHHLENSIFLISFGINDYRANYLPPNNGTLSKLDPDFFAQILLNELSFGVKKLYGLGARKFLVNNIWPLGCTPKYANQSDPLAICCNETINNLLLPYNNNLSIMLQNELQSNLFGAVISHSNDFQFVVDLKEHPEKYGISNTTGMCFFNNSICSDRNKYLYFDELHTTQVANHAFALNCFNGTLCSPRNIIHLVGA